MTNVFKIEIMVIDHDKLGFKGIQEVIENTKYPNYCISPEVKKAQFVTVDWSDGHPLNKIETSNSEYNKLFELQGKDYEQ